MPFIKLMFPFFGCLMSMRSRRICRVLGCENFWRMKAACCWSWLSISVMRAQQSMLTRGSLLQFFSNNR